MSVILALAGVVFGASIMAGVAIGLWSRANTHAGKRARSRNPRLLAVHVSRRGLDVS